MKVEAASRRGSGRGARILRTLGLCILLLDTGKISAFAGWGHLSWYLYATTLSGDAIDLYSTWTGFHIYVGTTALTYSSITSVPLKDALESNLPKMNPGDNCAAQLNDLEADTTYYISITSYRAYTISASAAGPDQVTLTPQTSETQPLTVKRDDLTDGLVRPWGPPYGPLTVPDKTKPVAILESPPVPEVWEIWHAPGAPENLTATPSSLSQISLRWNPSADGSWVGLGSRSGVPIQLTPPEVVVSGYAVFRDGVHIATTKDPFYLDSKAEPNLCYSYRVQAYSNGGFFSTLSRPADGFTLGGTDDFSPCAKKPESAQAPQEMPTSKPKKPDDPETSIGFAVGSVPPSGYPEKMPAAASAPGSPKPFAVNQELTRILAAPQIHSRTIYVSPPIHFDKGAFGSGDSAVDAKWGTPFFQPWRSSPAAQPAGETFKSGVVAQISAAAAKLKLIVESAALTPAELARKTADEADSRDAQITQSEKSGQNDVRDAVRGETAAEAAGPPAKYNVPEGRQDSPKHPTANKSWRQIRFSPKFFQAKSNMPKRDASPYHPFPAGETQPFEPENRAAAVAAAGKAQSRTIGDAEPFGQPTDAIARGIDAPQAPREDSETDSVGSLAAADAAILAFMAVFLLLIQ